MRGSSLSHPDALEILEPFLVTGWNGAYGRRMPADIRKLHREYGAREKNNVTFFVLDTSGEFVGAFHPFPGKTPASLGFSPDRMGRYLRDQVAKLLEKIEFTRPAKKKKLTLPDIEDGLRMFLTSDNMTGSPIIYTMKWDAEIRNALARTDSRGKIDAEVFSSWLSRIYPDGTMEKGAPYKAILGELDWKKAGANVATLTGDFRMPLAGQEGLAFEGTFKAAVKFEGKEVSSIRCVIRGSYPKKDRHRDRIREIRVEAAIESRSQENPKTQAPNPKRVSK